eukprot:scaffold1068_cov375-Prasinococcus_capsulatus_cf.AAC.6
MISTASDDILSPRPLTARSGVVRGGVGLKPGFRPEAKDWPGGGVEDYLKRVLEEIVPVTQQRYGCSAMPSQRAFGGSSFGGINAICMGMNHPGAFDNLIIESPSFWMAEVRPVSMRWSVAQASPPQCRLLALCGWVYSVASIVNLHFSSLSVHSWCRGASWRKWWRTRAHGRPGCSWRWDHQNTVERVASIDQT